MKKALLFLLILAPPLWGADPTIKLPEKVSGTPDTFLRVQSQTEGKVVRWLSVDPGLNLFPEELLRDTRTAVVIAKKPGQYRLYAWTALEGLPSAPALCIVVVTDQPPQPGPEPPPNPLPGPVPPNDPLMLSLQEAWKLEMGADRNERRVELQELFKLAAKAVKEDKTLKTVGDLFTYLRESISTLTAGSVPNLRGVINKELARVIPTGVSKELDLTLRNKLGEGFTRVAACLGGLR